MFTAAGEYKTPAAFYLSGVGSGNADCKNMRFFGAKAL